MMRPTQRPTAILTALALATATAAATGCGVDDPYSESTTTSTATTTSAPQAVATAPAPAPGASTPTQRAAPAVSDTVDSAAHPDDPRVRAAIAYTALQGTWTPETWVDQQRQLADLSADDALADLRASTERTPPARAAATFAQDRATSRTVPIGVDGPLTGDRVVVVSKTTATGAGRSDAPDYAVADVRLIKDRNRWLVRSFSIQP